MSTETTNGAAETGLRSLRRNSLEAFRPMARDEWCDYELLIAGREGGQTALTNEVGIVGSFILNSLRLGDDVQEKAADELVRERGEQ